MPDTSQVTKFEIINYNTAIDNADVIVYLIGYKEVIDFCGVTN